jgi:transposase InsO family protein
LFRSVLRKIIGWSFNPDDKDIVLNALLMAVWRRNPQKQVLVHSDQGSQLQAMSGSRSEITRPGGA